MYPKNIVNVIYIPQNIVNVLYIPQKLGMNDFPQTVLEVLLSNVLISQL